MPRRGGPRARRGDVRAAILALLAERPMHGVLGVVDGAEHPVAVLWSRKKNHGWHQQRPDHRRVEQDAGGEAAGEHLQVRPRPGDLTRLLERATVVPAEA